MPGSPEFSCISWNGNQIILIGTTHGAHTYHEEIVNKLENFRPSVILAEGVHIDSAAVEHRSAKNYSAISGATVKPLDTIPDRFGYEHVSYKNVSEDEFKFGPFDKRKMGTLTAIVNRYLVRLSDKNLYNEIIKDREKEMIYKMTYELERNNHNRMAVIFGMSHIRGIKKILRNC